MVINADKLYSVWEVAYILHLTKATINKYCRGGRLKASNIWSKARPKYLVDWEDLIRFITDEKQ